MDQVDRLGAVVITNEEMVPDKYKDITVKLNLATWLWLKNVMVGERQPIPQGIVDVSKSRIRAAIEAGEAVPGAELNTESYSLQVR